MSDDAINWVRQAIIFVLKFIEESEARGVEPNANAVLRALVMEHHITRADEPAR